MYHYCYTIISALCIIILSLLLLLFGYVAASPGTHTHMRAHLNAHTHARTNTHARVHTHKHTHTYPVTQVCDNDFRQPTLIRQRMGTVMGRLLVMTEEAGRLLGMAGDACSEGLNVCVCVRFYGV